MNTIKTWQERAKDAGEHPCVADGRVVLHMQSELIELRAALKAAHATPAQPVPNLIDEMSVEMQRLHDALAFWLPKVPEKHGPMRDRIVNDAYLLVGYDDIPDKQTAEELGWITIRPMETWRHERAGKFLFEVAAQFGWEDDGEGAFEFMQRNAYETGRADKKQNVPSPSPSSVGDAIRAMPHPHDAFWPSPSTVAEAIRKLPLPDAEVPGVTNLSSWELQVYARGALAMRSEAAAIAEQVQGQQVPKGWKLAPLEPTAAMVWAAEEIQVGNCLWDGSQATCTQSEAMKIYKAMLAAAPSIAQDGQKSEGV